MSLLDSIQGMVTPGMIGSLAQKFGLSPDKLGGSMGGIAGTLMSGLAGKAGDRSSMDSLSGLVNESPNEPEDFDRIADAPDDSPMKRRGNKLMDLATGGNPSTMIGGIGSLLGIGGGAAGGLLGSVAALAMGAMRKVGRTRRLDASSLGTLLHSESKSYRDAIPSSWRDRMPSLDQMQHARPVEKHRRSWWPLAAIAVAALAIWGLTRARSHKKEPASRPETSEVFKPSQGREARPGSQQQRMQQPSGESKLLTEARSPEHTGRAIPLEKVTFATGSSTLQPASDIQLSHVAQVLERYPNLRVSVAGYADSSAPNQALSQARATSVRDALVQKGVDSSRIQIAGASETTQGVSIKVLPEDNRG